MVYTYTLTYKKYEARDPKNININIQIYLYSKIKFKNEQ